MFTFDIVIACWEVLLLLRRGVLAAPVVGRGPVGRCCSPSPPRRHRPTPTSSLCVPGVMCSYLPGWAEVRCGTLHAAAGAATDQPPLPPPHPTVWCPAFRPNPGRAAAAAVTGPSRRALIRWRLMGRWWRRCRAAVCVLGRITCSNLIPECLASLAVRVHYLMLSVISTHTILHLHDLCNHPLHCVQCCAIALVSLLALVVKSIVSTFTL